MPIGTLTKKIHDQCRFCRIRPPITGPRIGAIIAGIETTLITRPIRRGPATCAMISCASGMIMPPPTPWSTLNTTSAVSVLDSPQAAEPTVNSASETRYTRLAPKRRAAQPVTGITAPSASR